MSPVLFIVLIVATAGALALAVLQFALARRSFRIQQELKRELMARDTQIERLQARLGQAHRMEAVGVFAGSIIHNLNNLLAVILGHTRLASQSAPGESRSREEMGKVLQAGQVAGDLVRDLSDFYRQADLARRPVDLQPVVRDTLKLLRDIVPRSIQIAADLEPCGPVLASPTGVQQVLMNLCSNSVKAMLRSQGKLTVTLREETVDRRQRALPRDLEPGTYVRLTVQDDGRGMDRRTLDRIYSAFYAEDTGAVRPGLGLATVCRILEHHDGVTIPQSAPGDGTTFSIYFPLIAWSVETAEEPLTVPQDAVSSAAAPLPVAAGEQEAAAGPTAVPGAGAIALRILLVDDEEMVADVMARGLARIGHLVTATTDARQALEWFTADPGRFDVVVTDQIMPHMSGVRLTREIRALRPDVPVVLTTGFRDSFHEQQAREAGVREFILKPCSHRDLADLLDRLAVRRMEGQG